jgi:hypothetical protein
MMEPNDVDIDRDIFKFCFSHKLKDQCWSIRPVSGSVMGEFMDIKSCHISRFDDLAL